ncbi:hypothetical protein ALO_20802 [Acetonema longum DSM 6540]|uniref:Uncharacterized protein n=1 Tax=Acetonema longum DSM 6540 TaxID=1009370 RepID=F7NPW3_9FIRM|nr:hypothetical protein ALO_20802 [Acetonema longum DSM 6540]
MGLAQVLAAEWAASGSITFVLQDGMSSYPVPQSLGTVWNGQTDGRAVEQYLDEMTAGLLLSSGNEKAILQQRAPTVLSQTIAMPVYDEVILTDLPFMGLRGACHMTERLWNQYMGFCRR